MIPADILTALFVALFMVLAYRAGVVAGKAIVRRITSGGGTGPY